MFLLFYQLHFNMHVQTPFPAPHGIFRFICRLHGLHIPPLACMSS